jgi:hypothetical protein
MRTRHLEPGIAGYLIAAVFAVCAGVELGMVVAGVTWGAFTPLASHGVSVLLAALWIVAALSVALRDRSRTLEMVAWTTAIPGAVLLFIHGFVATWGAGALTPASHLALVYSALAIAMAWLLRQAFGRGVVAPVPQPVPWRSTPRPAMRPAMAHSR